jgi:HEAT repeat protein
MDFVFNPGQEFATARLILKAILLSLLGIFHLIAFIAARRWHRARYFRRLSERTLALRSQWNGILDGTVCPRTWRLNRLDCELVEAMLLDSMEGANAEQLPGLLACLRSSGLLDLRIHQARNGVGWRQRSALVALGRTRAVEAVAALEEALDSPATETRIAAARGLGRTGLPQAAVAMLDHLLSDSRIHGQERLGQLLPSFSPDAVALLKGRRTPGADNRGVRPGRTGNSCAG